MIDSIKNSFGERIDFAFEPGHEAFRRGDWLVVLGHGVTGNKDRPVVVDTAAALRDAGFDTLRISFSGNGDSEGDFRESTITKEVGDLHAVLDTVSGHAKNIAYIGHSMGAAVGVLVAAQDTRIRALISLAGMVDTRRFAETEFGSITPGEGCMWEEESCPLSAAFMQDLCESIGSVAPAAAAVRVPWLLVHGSADDVVLPDDTRGIGEAFSAVTVCSVDGADHSFNDPAHKATMISMVCDWLAGITAVKSSP